MKQRSQPALRFRLTANGLEVFVGGKYLPADSQVRDNIFAILNSIAKEG